MNEAPPPPRDRNAGRRQANHNGGAFQTRLELTFLGYKDQNRAHLEKVDPPIRVMGGGKNRRVIFMKNPWLDFGGVWTEQGGRALHLEAKSTTDPRLSIGSDHGVTADQVDAIRRWSAAGAACAVVWWHADQMKIITAPELLDCWNSGAKSIKWRHVPAVHRGTGLIEFDILTELAARIC